MALPLPIKPPTPLAVVVDVESLRPDLDLVRIRAEASPVPIAPGTWCLFQGLREDMALVLPAGGSSAIPVPVWSIDEPERLPCDTIDPEAFLEGWGLGRWSKAHEAPISTRSKGQKPDAYGRGILKGFQDQERGRHYRPGSWAPYNELVRACAEAWPDEHSAPTLPRLRTLMAVAA